jgi:hypothetical protein
MSSDIVQHLFNKTIYNQTVTTTIARCVKTVYCRLLMKKTFTSCSILLALTSSIGFATAEAPSAQDQNYYLQTAQQIAATLQSGVAQLGSSDEANLSLLNATSDMKAVKEQDKSPNSSILEDHSVAELSLAAHFANEFKQADFIIDPDYKPGLPFEDARDVYTFCPSGSEVRRPVTLTTSVEGQPEYSWGWSDCSSRSAIRVQQMWVSNVKAGHPLLTLLMVEDDQTEKTRMELDLNQLIAGKISTATILKFIVPNNQAK